MKKVPESMEKPIKEIIKFYLNASILYIDRKFCTGKYNCPLCIEAQEINNRCFPEQCKSCPWMIVEGRKCVSSNEYRSWVTDSLAKRIKRLRKWLKIIETQRKED